MISQHTLIWLYNFLRRNSVYLHILVAGATTNNNELSIINPWCPVKSVWLDLTIFPEGKHLGAMPFGICSLSEASDAAKLPPYLVAALTTYQVVICQGDDMYGANPSRCQGGKWCKCKDTSCQAVELPSCQTAEMQHAKLQFLQFYNL